MFGKLMKLELNYLVRKFLPIWVIALVVTVLNFAVGIGNTQFMFFDDTMMTISLVLYIAMVVLVVVLSIAAFVQTCSRFYRSMFGAEGYLTHTLPVSVDALIFSKALSAMIMMLVTGLFTILMVVVMLLMVRHTSGLSLAEVFGTLSDLGFEGLEVYRQLAVTVAAGVVAELATIYMLYAAIAIGHLWREHPVGGGILAYIALTTVNSGLGGLLGINQTPETIYSVDEAMVTISRMTGMQLLLAAAMAVVCYFITRYIVKNKLNLQ